MRYYIPGSTYAFSYYEELRDRKNLDDCKFKASYMGIIGCQLA